MNSINENIILSADENEADCSKILLKNSIQINSKKNDESCRENEAKRIAERILRLIGPQFAVISLFILYLLFGAFCFRQFEPKFSKLHFTELVLFCFETLATIGYGNICPNSPIARLFTVVYSLLGIPLCMLTLVNLGKHITKLYATLVRTFTIWRKHRELKVSRPIGPSRLPWPILILFISLCLLGSAFYSPIPSIFCLNHFYFTVISFTTIGFGDFYPNTKGNIINLLVILSNLCLGMIFWGIWFQIAREWIQRLFRFKRRRFQHARDIQVNFGRKQMRLSSVLEAVAHEFKASPSQIHQVLNDLDFLISDALDGGSERAEKNNKSDN